MKTPLLYLVLLITFVQCRKESEDCHFFVTIQNNSDNDVVFSTPEFLLDPNSCSLFDENTLLLSPSQSTKYRPYPHPDCIERVLEFEGNLRALFIVDPNNYTTDAVPCEEFEERNTILRTYILTLADLERMNYTINYPEDASIGID